MGRRNSGTYGGSAAMFPTEDRTPVQKLARVRRWIADYEAYATNPDATLARKARTKVRQYKAVAEVLEIAIRQGKGWNELQGVIEEQAA